MSYVGFREHIPHFTIAGGISQLFGRSFLRIAGTQMGVLQLTNWDFTTLQKPAKC